MFHTKHSLHPVLAGPSYSEEPGPLLWHTPSQGEEDWALLLSHLGRGSIFWCRGPPALLHLCTLNIIVTIHRKLLPESPGTLFSLHHTGTTFPSRRSVSRARRWWPHCLLGSPPSASQASWRDLDSTSNTWRDLGDLRNLKRNENKCYLLSLYSRVCKLFVSTDTFSFKVPPHDLVLQCHTPVYHRVRVDLASI